MDSNWKKVFSSNSAYEVELLAALLKDEDIECVVVNKKDSMYLFGEVDLLVNQEQYLKALQIIKDKKE